MVVTQHVAYKVSTRKQYNDVVADNLLNQNFKPVAASKCGQVM